MSSLQELRRYFMRRKMRGFRVDTTGVEDSPAWVGEVINTNPDQRRIVVSSNWLSQGIVGGAESDLSTDTYSGSYLYLPDTGEQRRVTKLGYLQAEIASDITDQAALTSTYVGALTVDRPFGAVVAANQDVEISARLPILDTDLLTGVNSMLNFALGRMVTPKRIAFSGVTSQERYSLDAYPWLKHQDQLIGVPAPEPTLGVEPVRMMGQSSIRRDGQRTYLIPGSTVTTGETFWIDAWMPLSAWISVGGTWGTSTAGLVNESDEADVDPTDLALVAYYFACDELAEHGPDGERGMWSQRREAAAQAAAPFMKWQRERYEDQTGTRSSSDSWDTDPRSSYGTYWP